VIVIGPCADSTDVGEALSTWRWTSGLAEHVDVTLLTYVKRGRCSAKESLPNVRVIEWADLPIPARFERLNAAFHLGYTAFYFKARRWIKRALASGEQFDLVHQLAPLAMRYPSPAAGLSIPLVVGPLAGSLSSPDSFARELAAEPWYVKLRRFDDFRLRHDPLLRGTYESAAVVVGVAPYVKDVLHRVSLRNFAVECETGVVEMPPAVVRDFNARPLKLLFVGRIVRTKGLRDAVRAMALVRDLDVVLDVVGGGGDLDACRAEAASLGVDDRVRFHGRKARAEVDTFYREAHAFLFPSFREPSGNVVIEAMSWGLPMIVADRGGPAHAVPPAAGTRVLVEDPESFRHGLADAIRRLAADPSRAQAQSVAAREAVQATHLWPTKIQRMLEMYDRVLQASGSSCSAAEPKRGVPRAPSSIHETVPGAR